MPLRRLPWCVLLFLPGLARADSLSAVDTVWIAVAAALVFFMQAGFALLESGLSRAKNALNVVMKNYMDLCVGTLVFWGVGFGLMFGTSSTGWFGENQFMLSQADASTWAMLLFQIMFAATAPVRGGDYYRSDLSAIRPLGMEQ